jgi:hypothetical protein
MEIHISAVIAWLVGIDKTSMPAYTDRILESLVTGTLAKATVTSQYSKTTAPNGSYHQASYTNSQLRLVIHRIAHPME